MASRGGPWLAAALLCERVMEEKDGVLSAIRIVDRIVTTAGPDAPEEMRPVPVNLTALIALKSGAARGKESVRLRMEAPSGIRVGNEIEIPVLLEGEDRGANVVLNLGFQATEEGLYWFDVLVGDSLVTRMPLRIVYQRLGLGAIPAGA